MNLEGVGPLVEALPLLDAEAERRRQSKIRRYFPDEGPLRRALYVKHMSLIGAGLTHRERLFLAANRVGKTEVGAYELTHHLTGQYPQWWHGKRFNGPIEAWAAGDTNISTRDILQASLLGPPSAPGTGFIPSHLIHHQARKPGVPDAVQSVWVKHVSGELSTLEFKSYDQGRRLFQGTAKHFIWLDEEPPQDVYTECLLRTMTTSGLVLMTFTPLQGLTPLVVEFLEGRPEEQR